MAEQKGWDICGGELDRCGAVRVDSEVFGKGDGLAGKGLGADRDLKRTMAHAGVVVGQLKLKAEPCETRVRKVRQVGDDPWFGDRDPARGAQINGLPDTDIPVMYFRDPVPAYGAEHSHVLADIPGRAAVLEEIAKRLQLRG